MSEFDNISQDKSGKELGKILYFDPNVTINNESGNVLNDIFKGIDLMKDPEDFSIAIDLEITTKSRDNITTTDGSTTTTYNFHSQNKIKSSNFTKGSEIGKGDTLTTFFTDITYDPETSTASSEAMSIESIDIEFTSWYVASVIIKFTDVRGASLFSPAEYTATNKNSSEDSLFSGFFTMPYPMFSLKVKGFYGDAVTYPLHCQDFKAEFNAEKGNFDLTVQFIGFTYALLSDIQIPYILAAPYLSEYGAPYWDDQIKNGRFLTLEGNELPKISDILKKIKQGEYSTSKLKDGAVFKSADLINTKYIHLNKIRSTIDEYINALNNNGKLIITRTDNKYKIIISDPSNNLEKSLSVFINVSTYAQTLYELISAYNNTYNSTGSTENDIIFNDFSTIDYFYVQNINKKENITTGIIDLSKIIDKIELRQANNLAEQKKVIDNINASEVTSIIETYQMVPSIYNFSKLMLAHMETLLYSIAACANNASKENNREIATSGEYTDLTNNKLSPFPWITVNKDGKQCDDWLGNNHPNFSEVKLVKSFIKAKTEVSREIEHLETMTAGIDFLNPNSSLTVGDIWFPINAFDNSISLIGGKSHKPYANLIEENGVDINELKAVLSTRIATLVGLSDIDSKNENSFILAESSNIINELGNNIILIQKVITALNEIKKHTNDDEYKTLKFYKINNQNFEEDSKLIGYEYNLLNSNVLPLNDESIKTHKKNIYNGKIISNNNFKFYSNNVKEYPSTELTIIEGKNNAEIITQWFSQVQLKIGDVSNLNGSLTRYKLDRKYSSLYFNINDNLIQPIINRIGFNKPIMVIGKNDDTLKPLYEYCGYFEDGIKGNKLFKLYLNENNKEAVDKLEVTIKRLKRSSIFLEQNNNIDNLTYPWIGGYYLIKSYSYGTTTSYGTSTSKEYSTTIPMSLFGSSIYYAQNDHMLPGPSFDINKARRAKAFLFLQTLPINLRELDNLFNDSENSKTFMIRLPKASLLLLGSMLYRKKIGDSFLINSDNIIIPDTYKYLKSSEKSSDFTLIISDKNYDQYLTCDLLSKINKDSITEKELIKYFEDWVDADITLDGWQKIESEFELQPKTGTFFNKSGFELLSQKLMAYGNEYLNEYLKDNYIKNYDLLYYEANNNLKSIILINKDGSDGVKCILDLLFEECVIAFTGNAKFSYNPINNFKETDLSEQRVNNVVNLLIMKMNEREKELKTITTTLIGSDNSINSTKIINNDEENLMVYKYLKTLYDKWVSGYVFNTDKSEYKWIDSVKRDLNGFNTYKIKNMNFIDRSYNDIGDKLIVNFKEILEKIIDSNEQKSLYSVFTDIFSKNNFLFIPMPNYSPLKDIKDLKEIFKPIPYNQSNMVNNNNINPLFICMYVGSPSKSLNIGTNNYSYQDDALNLSPMQEFDIPGDFTKLEHLEINDGGEDLQYEDSMNNVPVFAVSYGKQNQSYFKNIILNQNNPVTTFASILALKNLNEKNDSNSSVTLMSQDLYDVYSSYSYTCQVEMLGCAQIQPMMYFQLTNSPMWNGAYLIYKVNHSIRAGYMTTSFTGMRLSKNYPKIISPRIASSDDLSSSIVTISPNDNNSISSLSMNTQIGNFKLKDYAKNQTNLSTTIVQRIYKYLSPIIEDLYVSWNSSQLNNNYGPFIITNAFVTTYKNEKSMHLEGLAADIQIAKNNNNIKNKALFEHIKSRMKHGTKIDQLILEDSNNGGICHVGVIKVDDTNALIRGEVMTRVGDKDNWSYKDKLIIEEAKGGIKQLNLFSPYITWLNYWKKAENGINKGWDKNKKLWFKYDSPESVKPNASVIDKAPTIAYGIKLYPGYLKSLEMDNNIQGLSEGTIGISEGTAIAEIKLKAEEALRNIERIITSKHGVDSFKNMEEKYKYALVDIYMNIGNINGWTKFINAAVNNDLNGMLAESDRGNVQRTKLFREYLNS